MRLSVIIPTLNESRTLERTIGWVRLRGADKSVELIVADCGSSDETVTLAERLGLRVATGASLNSRARACNAGAALATGDTLLFLHADCEVPDLFDRLIAGALAHPRAVGGAFEFKLDGPELRLRFVEQINRLRYRLMMEYYGDQGIFVRRSVFEACGGYLDLPILEDAHFCRLVSRFGVLRLIRSEIRTSPRRFYHGGILRTLAMDAVIWVWNLLCMNPNFFAAVYRRENLDVDDGCRRSS
ncbi:MAG: TIGR04283 family arsenosugar biosynthesis glycosyltransferase [Phycisphaerae bacterium]